MTVYKKNVTTQVYIRQDNRIDMILSQLMMLLF